MSLRPVLLHEFDDLRISWAMCRNPMCKQFGVFYDDVNTNLGGRNGEDTHYILDTKRWRLKCRYCRQSTQMISNEAIRPVARYFLSQSLPFADCPSQGCDNHGKNLFEHFVPKISSPKRVYRRVDDNVAKCQLCGIEFSFGQALHISRDNNTNRKLRDVIISNIKSESVTDAIESSEMSVGAYYRALDRVSARLRDKQSHLNASLLKEKWSRQTEPLRVYTDTLQITLQETRRKKERHKILNVIVSVVETTYQNNPTYYLLAAHPYFLPERFCPDQKTLEKDRTLQNSQKQWSCLEHLLDDEEQGDHSMNGYFISSPYPEIAHFLVIQKMLRRFQKSYHYMDCDKSLQTASMVAYRERILADRSEFVLFQYQKGNDTRVSRPSTLHSAWEQAEKRFDDKITSKEALLPEPEPDTDARHRIRATLFKQSLHGAYSKTGKWAWLHWPPSKKQYKNPFTLWLTRRMHKTLEEHGRQLLESPDLHSIDSQFNSIRERMSAANRPKVRTKQGRSFKANNIDPDVAVNELAVYVFANNFRMRKKRSRQFTPGKAMRILTKEKKSLDMLPIVENFRLNLKHAEQITRWTRSRQERQWPG